MEKKVCQNCKKNFTIEPDDLSFYERMQVPPPTFCPFCRFQRRAVFRNERKLFRVKDAFTGKDIFSLYPAEANRKVVTQEEWHGDSWSALDYGRDIDWSRPFLAQVLELEKEVPIYNLNVKLMVNSPYCGNATGLKNCYLCFNSNRSENCLYGNSVDYSTDCVDVSHINHSERCYDSFWLEKSYQCHGCVLCGDSRNLWFSRSCIGCNDCFGCMSLRKSSYCIFNKQYTKEEYKEFIDSLNLHTAQGFAEARKKAREFWLTRPVRSTQGLRNVHCTGTYVTESKNVLDSYLVRGSENMRYCQNMLVPGNKECMDTTVWGENTQLSYETCVSGDNSYNLKFCFSSWPACHDSEYCMNMFSSADCFGCVGVRSAQYCILNKKYEKDEYKTLVEKIKKHMDDVPYVDAQGLVYKYGEFFPIEFSPFGYNNSLTIEHFPLTEEEALKKGYAWIDPEKGNYAVSMQSSDIPESIKDVTDDITKEIIACSQCRRPYRIVADELTFLRKENLPLPRLCVDCRHKRRIGDRLSIQLYDRTCMCSGKTDDTDQYQNLSNHEHSPDHCSNDFKTGYAPESGMIVYCEQCYQREVAQ